MSDAGKEQMATDVAESNEVTRIRAGIERTQADLASTVAELQQKLTVSHFLGQTRKAAGRTLEDLGEMSLALLAIGLDEAAIAGRRAQTYLRRNPGPATLIGAGLAAVLWHGSRRAARRAESRNSR